MSGGQGGNGSQGNGSQGGAITRTFGCAIHFRFPGEHSRQIAASLHGSAGLPCLVEGEQADEEARMRWRLLGGPALPTPGLSLTLTSPRLKAQEGLDHLKRMVRAAKEAGAEPTGGFSVWINAADMLDDAELEQLKKVCVAFIAYEPALTSSSRARAKTTGTARATGKNSSSTCRPSRGRARCRRRWTASSRQRTRLRSSV
eukprot:2919966-Prymnesium_polylepis.1